MNKFTSVLLMACILGPPVFAIDGKNAAYFGGTIVAYSGATDPIEGKLDTFNPDQLAFIATDKKFKAISFVIPYSRILDIEYGQKAGRRVGAAVATTILLGPIGLLSLFSKKRKHYLTIGFKDELGKDQVAVMELGKDIVRATLPIVQTRSGKTIQYQDDEARNASR